MKQRILVIVGPTSSGKSALAVELARKFNGEVISADSRQVYRGLDIGTGKIKKREMRGVAHHLLDVTDPKKLYTAEDYRKAATRAIADIARRGKLPIVAGGTGFYIDALVGRITLPAAPPNMKLRARLEKKTAPQLYALLKKQDPHRAKTIDKHNKRRLVRALEIAAAIGKSPQAAPLPAEYDVLWIGVMPPKKILDAKIAARLSARMQEGMIAEARQLHRKGLAYKRMGALGLEYRSLARLLEKKISRQEFERELLRDIRRYSKRQLTYWRRNKNIEWFESKQKKIIEKRIGSWRAH
ncbi:tRNA (adenosine(37)-N6)-dimethylallyltransferase MiaA [Candidatus Parcubacteria bacterium]|nr:MAG: tRNA (adenosine(37)-N6)-dimethylallyltransferase MiaA [Candidatus Parcubacteria bacterium]